MKMTTSRTLALLASPLVLLSPVSCKKKEAATPPKPAETTATEAPAPAETAPERDVVAERVAKLGFLRQLPQDTEVVMSLFQASEIEKRLRASKTGALVIEEAKANGAESLETPKEVSELLGREVTIAFGKGSAEQTGKLLALNRRYNFQTMRALARALTGAKPEASPADQSSLPSGRGVVGAGEAVAAAALGTAPFAASDVSAMLKELANDPELGPAFYGSLRMPPLLLAFGVDAASRWSVDKTVKDGIGEAKRNLDKELPEETAEELSFTNAGIEFKGFRLPGAKVTAAIGKEQRDQLEGLIGKENADKLIASLATKNIVLASGSTESHVIVFLGSSPDDLVLASSPSDSLLASSKLDFFNDSASKEVIGLIHVDEAVSGSLLNGAGGFADVAAGFIEGLRESDGLTDTVKLQGLLAKTVAAETALRKLQSNADFGAVAFLEDGLRIESYGGAESGAFSWTAPNRMASLGDDESVALFANFQTTDSYDSAARAYLESLAGAFYEAALVLSDSEDMASFREKLIEFDQKYRAEAVTLWSSMSAACDGLGGEKALVLDLKGAVPAVPGAPAALIEKGNLPRISFLAPVSDRTKLATAWQEANSAITSILESAGEDTGTPIPMQTPMSTKENGDTTWFFPLPFFTDNFLPSVTVSDDLYAVSTSKTQALDLFKAARKATPGRPGLYVAFRSKPMGEFIDKTIRIIEDSPEMGLDPQDAKLAEFKKVLDALEEFEGFTVHAREEGGTLRVSSHFKMAK